MKATKQTCKNARKPIIMANQKSCFIPTLRQHLGLKNGFLLIVTGVGVSVWVRQVLAVVQIHDARMYFVWRRFKVCTRHLSFYGFGGHCSESDRTSVSRTKSCVQWICWLRFGVVVVLKLTIFTGVMTEGVAHSRNLGSEVINKRQNAYSLHGARRVVSNSFEYKQQNVTEVVP